MKRKNDAYRNHIKLVGLLNAVLLVAILLCVGKILLTPYSDCRAKPDILEYPQARIIATNILLDASYLKMYSYTYETADSYEDVRAFYDTRSDCRTKDSQTTCLTETEPYVSYTIYLNESLDSPYQFTAELVWNIYCVNLAYGYEFIE